jgi:transcriptional regulator with XRE-family HTH domain
MAKKTVRQIIAERLKKHREKANLSQEYVANTIGIQRPAVSEIEAGKRKVSAEEIIKFSKLYGVKVFKLLP